MELRVLRYFLAVADEGNLTRAAERLNMTQPSLSRQISALERELGCTLLERGKRGVTLTADGRLLRRRAQQMVSMADRLEFDFATRSQEVAGSLAVGSVETYAADVLPRLLAALWRRAPRVRVDVLSGNADEVADWLDDGTLDFGLLREPIDRSRFQTIALPEPDIWGALVPSGSQVAALPETSAMGLASERLLVPSRGVLMREMLSWFEGVPLEFEPVTYNALSTAVSLVRAGLGCAICPSVAQRIAGEDAVFVPLSPRHETRGGLSWKPSLSLEPAASVFIDVAQEVLGPSANDA